MVAYGSEIVGRESHCNGGLQVVLGCGWWRCVIGEWQCRFPWWGGVIGKSHCKGLNASNGVLGCGWWRCVIGEWQCTFLWWCGVVGKSHCKCLNALAGLQVVLGGGCTAVLLLNGNAGFHGGAGFIGEWQCRFLWWGGVIGKPHFKRLNALAGLQMVALCY